MSQPPSPSDPTIYSSASTDPTLAMPRKRRAPWWLLPLVAVLVGGGWWGVTGIQQAQRNAPKMLITWLESTPTATTGHVTNLTRSPLHKVRITISVPRAKIPLGTGAYTLSANRASAVWGEKVIYKDLHDPITGITMNRSDPILETDLAPNTPTAFTIPRGALSLPVNDVRVTAENLPVRFKQAVQP